jgi:hypothetical protein
MTERDTLTAQRYTPSEAARRILSGAVRDYTGLGKGCHCSGEWVCGDCAIGQAVDHWLALATSSPAVTTTEDTLVDVRATNVDQVKG